MLVVIAAAVAAQQIVETVRATVLEPLTPVLEKLLNVVCQNDGCHHRRQCTAVGWQIERCCVEVHDDTCGDDGDGLHHKGVCELQLRHSASKSVKVLGTLLNATTALPSSRWCSLT